MAIDKEQLEIATKLSAVIDGMARSAERLEKSFETQVSVMEKLQATVNQVSTTKAQQELSSLNNVKLDKLQKGIDEVSQSTSGMIDKIRTAGKELMKKFPSAVTVGAGAISGFGQGIRNVIALTKGVSGFFASFIDGAATLSASIIAIPFKMFNALVDLAAKAGGGSNELAQAIENLRKEMGDLKGPGTSAVISTSQALKGFSDTGLSVMRVFGTLAERIELMTKVAVAMGSTFGMLTKEFKEAGGALLGFQKGLGVSDEQMKSIGDRAITMGKTMSKTFIEMTKQTLALGKAFDIDQKLIGKDMAKALQDVKHFGALAVKEIAQASVYARKLGLELDKIVGTLDAFETFDTAAENVAKLSQTFGVQLDAFKLMESQNPAEQLDMLRDSFKKAGVDASQFTRQQARMLAMTTNLDEATVRQAFSASNYGTSLEDIKKKSEAAEKKTMTQAEAMSKLADSIERLVKSGGAQEGGFWDMFVKGFLGGIQASKEFREIIWNIKRGLSIVYMEGVRLGKAFVELFPGVKDVLGGIADFFKPQKFKMLAKGVVDELIQFFKDLTDPNGKASFSGLMTKLREKFFDFFDSQMPAGKKMLEGFKTVFKTMSRLAADGIRWVADQVAKGIKFIVEIIRDPSKLSSMISAGSGTLGFIGEILMPLVDALGDAWKVVAPAALDLLKTVATKVYDFLKSDEFINLIKPALPVLAAALFGPAFGRAMLTAITTSIAQSAVGFFTGSASKKVIEEAGAAASKAVEASRKVASKSPDTKGIDASAKVMEAGATASKSADKVGLNDLKKLGMKLLTLSSVLIVGGVAIATSVILVKKILDAGGIRKLDDAVIPVGVLAGVALASVPLAIAMKIAGRAGSMADVIKGGLIITAAIGIVGAVSAGLAYLLKKVGTPAELAAAGNIMLKMSLVFLAMVPLIFASMAIGALASGPQAVALAAAAVGLGVIGVAVGEMAMISMEIIQELNKLKVDSSFQKKIDAFLGVMRAIQSFADTMVNLVSLMNPTFTEFLSGSTESFSKKVDASVILIQEMVGQRGGNKGIIGVVETVMDSIRQLNIGGPGMAEAAKIFADVLSGITEFMKAAAPSDQFYEQGGSFINKLVDPQHNFANLATDVGYYAKTMREGAMEMLTGNKNGQGDGGVLGLITKMSTLSIPDPKSAEIVSGLINSTAQMLKFITPSPETLKAFTDTSETDVAWGLVKEKTSNINGPAIAGTITAMGEQFKTILPALTSTVIKSVTDQAMKMSKDDIEKVKVLGDVLKIVIDLTNSLGNALKTGQAIQVGTINSGAVVNVMSAAPSLAKALEEIQQHVGPLMNRLVEVVRTVPTDKNFAKNLEVAKTLFSFISEIPKLAQSISATHQGGGGDVSNIEPMVQSVKSMSTFMGRLVADFGENPLKVLLGRVSEVGKTITAAGGDKLGKVIDMLKGMFGSLATLGGNLKSVATLQTVDPQAAGKALMNVIESVSKTVDPLKSAGEALTPEVMKQVSDSVSRIKEYGDQVSKITNAIKGDAVTGALKAASDMVKVANDLDAALSGGIKIETPAKLKKLAQAVGLGSKTNYTITNKMVQLTVNLNVTMDVGEVEKVMIMRQQSIIRERLNFALENPSDKAAPPIPDTFSSGFNAGNLARSSP